MESRALENRVVKSSMESRFREHSCEVIHGKPRIREVVKPKREGGVPSLDAPLVVLEPFSIETFRAELGVQSRSCQSWEFLDGETSD